MIRALAAVCIGVATVCVAGEAAAQNTMPNLPQIGSGPEVRDRGPEPPNQPSLLNVTATRPIVLPTARPSVMMQPDILGTFRMAFRVTSTGSEMPFVALGYGGFRSDFTMDWRAFSSTGARCILVREKLYGVDVYSGGTTGAASSLRSLLRETSAGSVAKPSSATIVSADFDCDQPVRVGDTMTVQIKFYVLGPSGWRTATYSFDDRPVGANR